MTEIRTTDAQEDWWRTAVIYQIYPRSFADSNGDGVGDLTGIIGRVDHLVRLGVDAVWLSPIYTSPQDDNGYDISDYRSIDPAFGTLDDFDELVRVFHANGLKLVMDLVVNHTSDEHAWFRESRSSLDNPRRDWYHWRSEPNNWTAAFTGSAWELDPATDEYYLHLFSRKQPDLNWDNPDVRAAVYEMMNWWLDRGVDGFRMDVINMISKDDGLPDAPPRPDGTHGSGDEHYTYGPHLHEYLQEMHREVFLGRPQHILTVGEMPGSTVEQAALFTDPQRRELDMIFQFEHVDIDIPFDRFDPMPLDLVALKKSMARWQEGLAASGWNSLYWGNHDQPRAVSRFGNDGEYRVRSAKLLGAVLHFMRGTPYIFEGEELGMTNPGFETIDEYRDIQTLNYWTDSTERLGRRGADIMPGIRRMSRDNARTPMQWTGEPGAGFTTGTPWIGIGANSATINAEAEYANPDSVFAFYRRLIELRHSKPLVALGDFTMLHTEHPRLFCYSRSLDGTSLLLVANFSSAPLELPADLEVGWAHATPVLGNVDGSPAWSHLAAWEVRVFTSSIFTAE